jgi:hypothetical protein
VDLTLIFQGLTALGALIGGLALVWIAIELSGVHSVIGQIERSTGRIGSSHAIHQHSRAGYGIYVYRNNRWELESDLSAPGYEPSPPTVPGAYEGHVVKKESWPKARP